jgi:polysaccharide biosynthesis/export protein
MKKKYYIFIIFFGCVLFSQTNREIQDAKNALKSSGLSIESAKKIAKSKGYSDKQIEDVIKRGSNNEGKEPDFLKKQDMVIPESVQKSVSESLGNKVKATTNVSSLTNWNDEKTRHFGYDIFNNDPAIFQNTNIGASDPNYIIGPKDEIVITLWGETQFRQVLAVNKDGSVLIPEVGQVFVNGLNLNLLESKLFNVLSQSYNSLNPTGRESTTFLDVSLGKLRPLRIQVLGYLKQPGAYTVSPSSTIYSSLYYFNGPDTLGSLRNIQLIRKNKEIATIDFYDFLLTGKKPKDLSLQLDDVVFIPKRLKTVTIIGEVNIPAIFELDHDETLKDLILFAGGLRAEAYLKHAQIERIVPYELRENNKSNRIIVDFTLGKSMESADQIKLIDQDIITIHKISDNIAQSIEINGAVNRPGKYEYYKDLQFSSLIEKADGFRGDAYKKRIEILRQNKDFSDSLITVSLNNSKKNINEIKLSDKDKVYIYSLDEIKEKRFAKIEGYVRRPGAYKIHENMLIRDLLFKAGGFDDEEFRKKIYFDKADLIRTKKNGINKKVISINLKKIIEDSLYNQSLGLKSNDLIRIYSKDQMSFLGYVTIEGAVNKPGTYLHKDEMYLNDLILESGGIINDVFNYKIDIARIDTNSSNQLKLAEIKSLKNHDLKNKKILLLPYDFISVRPDPNFQLQKTVEVLGEVQFPGSYVIQNNQERISDLIEKAGGLKKTAFLSGSKYFRNEIQLQVDLEKALNKNKSISNFIVNDKDKIKILKKPNSVFVQGEVSVPGFYQFSKKRNLSYYLKISGGLTNYADIKNIYVKSPSGISQKLKYSKNLSFINIFNKNIEDGSIIVVNKKEEKEELDITEFLKEVASIMASFAQALAIVILARG